MDSAPGSDIFCCHFLGEWPGNNSWHNYYRIQEAHLTHPVSSFLWFQGIIFFSHIFHFSLIFGLMVSILAFPCLSLLFPLLFSLLLFSASFLTFPSLSPSFLILYYILSDIIFLWFYVFFLVFLPHSVLKCLLRKRVSSYYFFCLIFLFKPTSKKDKLSFILLQINQAIVFLCACEPQWGVATPRLGCP